MKQRLSCQKGLTAKWKATAHWLSSKTCLNNDMKKIGTSTIESQVMWNRLISIVEEQAQALVRTAFSTSVREAGDLSAGIFDCKGRMLAQAVTGTPGHVNAMADAVPHFIRDIGGQNIFEADVYVTNDPWKGTGHLHDFTFVSPSFHNGKLVAFFAATAHVVDIGGRGFGADADSVYEEGLCVPIMKFAQRGELNQSLIELIRHNVRVADQVIGDLFSLAGCNETGHNRLMDMLAEYGLDDIEPLSEYIIDHSYNASVDALSQLPGGTAHNELTVDGYFEPVKLAVRLSLENDGVFADFSGTGPTSPRGINVPLVYTKAYACYGLKCILVPEIPNNTGSLAPFRITAPRNCILNAHHPAPVSVRHVIGHFIPDLVMGALHQLLPGRVPAEGASALWNIHISTRLAEREPDAADDTSEILMFNSGGSGARPTLDGLNATAFPSGVHTMPIEATEQVGPIIVWKKQLRPDSGGAGRFRGGLGQSMEIGAVDGYEYHFSAMFDRVSNAARGREGGMDGACGSVRLDDGTIMKTKGRQLVPAGKRLLLELPGGGGYGKPDLRSRDAIRRDLAREYLSHDKAAHDYPPEVTDDDD
jgi:N-methylhydantoinase B